MTSGLFRGRAMSRSAGQERLDERLRVVTVSGWIGLAIGVIVVASLLAWSVLGTTRRQVSGPSLLVRAPYTFIAEAPAHGYLVTGPPPPGSTVTQGQQLGLVRELDQPEAAATPVLAPVSGTLISRAAERGAVVVTGQDIAYLEVPGPMVAQAFIPTDDGKRVELGMSAEVEPSTAPSASYGRMLATVSAVSEYSVTPDHVRTVVGHGALADRIIGGPPVLLVTLTLSSTVGGAHPYRWTSGGGPPFTISSGTLAEATVTLSTSRPIDSVLGRVTE